MRMVQKGQLRYAGKDVCAHNKLINKVFGLAATVLALICLAVS